MKKKNLLKPGFFISIAALASSSSAGNSLGRWDGTWSGMPDSGARFEVTLKDDMPQRVQLGVTVVQVTSNELSPDRKTIVFRWDGGEGTLYRLKDDEAELNIFDRRTPVRSVRVKRN